MSVLDLESEILKLPTHERARLAELLISSLDEEDEIAAAWVDEAERRYQQLLAGEVEGVPAEDVLARLRASLR